MERVFLDENFSISRIVQGFWRLKSWNQTPEETLKFMEACIERGITTFDNADIYLAEEYQGKAMQLKPEIRGKIEIVTKCGIKPKMELFKDNDMLQYDSSKEHILTSVDNSLKRLGIEYIDLLLIHRPDFLMDPNEINEAFNILKKSGKVRHFGVSNFKNEEFEMLQSFLDVKLVTNQIEMSVMHLDPLKDGSLNNIMKNKIYPMIWSPLSGGRIFKNECIETVKLRKTLERVKEEIGANNIDEVMYAWLLKHPAKVIPIVGSGKLSRVDCAVNATKLNLTRSNWYEIYQCANGRDLD